MIFSGRGVGETGEMSLYSKPAELILGFLFHKSPNFTKLVIGI